MSGYFTKAQKELLISLLGGFAPMSHGEKRPNCPYCEPYDEEHHPGVRDCERWSHKDLTLGEIESFIDRCHVEREDYGAQATWNSRTSRHQDFAERQSNKKFDNTIRKLTELGWEADR